MNINEIEKIIPKEKILQNVQMKNSQSIAQYFVCLRVFHIQIKSIL